MRARDAEVDGFQQCVLPRRRRKQFQRIARVVGGKLRLEMRDVSLPQLLREAVETAKPAADAKQIRIDTNIDERMSTIGARSWRLRAM